MWLLTNIWDTKSEQQIKNIHHNVLTPQHYCFYCHIDDTKIKTPFFKHTCSKEFCIWCLQKFKQNPIDTNYIKDEQFQSPYLQMSNELKCCNKDRKDDLEKKQVFMQKNCVICGLECKSQSQIFINQTLFVGKECFYGIYIAKKRPPRQQAVFKQIMKLNEQKCSSDLCHRTISVLDGQKYERDFKVCSGCLTQHKYQTIKQYQAKQHKKCYECSRQEKTVFRTSFYIQKSTQINIILHQNIYYCIPCLFALYQVEFNIQKNCGNQLEIRLKFPQRKQFQYKMLQGCFGCSAKIQKSGQVFKFSSANDSLNDLLKYSCKDCISIYLGQKKSCQEIIQFQRFEEYIQKNYGVFDKQTQQQLSTSIIKLQMQAQLKIISWQNELKQLQRQSFILRDPITSKLRINPQKYQSKLQQEDKYQYKQNDQSKPIQLSIGQIIQNQNYLNNHNYFKDFIGDNINESKQFIQADVKKHRQQYKQSQNTNYTDIKSNQFPKLQEQSNQTPGQDQFNNYLQLNSFIFIKQTPISYENNKIDFSNITLPYPTKQFIKNIKLSIQQQKYQQSNPHKLSNISNKQNKSVNSMIFQKDLDQQEQIKYKCRNPDCVNEQYYLNLSILCSKCFLTYLFQPQYFNKQWFTKQLNKVHDLQNNIMMKLTKNDKQKERYLN